MQFKNFDNNNERGLDMWKLTISQKRKSEYTNSIIEERVIFTDEDINELSMIVVRLSMHENGIETSYKFEMVGEESESV